MRHLYIYLIVMILFSVSCKQKELPTIDIKNVGTIGWEVKEPCTITFTDANATDELNGRIKYRGGGSSRYYKHSFALELDNKYSFPNLPNDDDWILNANYIDKTFMRHKISYDLFREMNAKNIAAKGSFINVSINDKYEGLYVLMEEINGAMVGLNKNDTMAMLFKDPPIFSKDSINHVRNFPNYYQQKHPNINKIDKTYLIEDFKNFLFYSNDIDFARNITTWVDIKNVIDWHILLLFTNNSDGIMKNFYLYKLDNNTPFRFAIWDYDHSFGRDGDNERNLMERELNCNRAILLERLSNIPDIGYLPKLKKRWLELRELNIISSKNFEKHIIKNDKIISKEIGRNFEKWPINSKWYYDSSDYNQELDLMREFVIIRINQLDEYFNSPS
jgi:hypothetical protein